MNVLQQNAFVVQILS